MTQKLLEKVWINCWENELNMKYIWAWVEQIPWHIQKIIRLKKGNEYQEDRFNGASNICLYNCEAQKKQY